MQFQVLTLVYITKLTAMLKNRTASLCLNCFKTEIGVKYPKT